MSKYFRFISRTVQVDISPGVENALDSALQTLESRLNREGVIQSMKRNRYYEKPWMKRRRVAYQNCKQIYNSEMNRKIDFLMKANRKDPWRV